MGAQHHTIEMFKGLFGNGNKTLKRNKKTFDAGTKKYELHKYAKTTLGLCDLEEAVLCPDEEFINDWLAVHVQDFYNQTMMVYACIESECTEEKCPEMAAGDRYKYLWMDADSVENKKPTKVHAALYCELLFAWTDRQLEDPEIFPKDDD